MTIVLQTALVPTQMVQHVENLFAAIERHYMVEHSERSASYGLSIQFGRNPIKENSLKFVPKDDSGYMELYIYNISDTLAKRLTGKSAVELGEEAKRRREEGNARISDAYAEPVASFFGTSGVKLDVNTYMGSTVNVHYTFHTIGENTLSVISTLLQHCGMTPKAPSVMAYAL